jgi:hypothetical protein
VVLWCGCGQPRMRLESLFNGIQLNVVGSSFLTDKNKVMLTFGSHGWSQNMQAMHVLLEAQAERCSKISKCNPCCFIGKDTSRKQVNLVFVKANLVLSGSHGTWPRIIFMFLIK